MKKFLSLILALLMITIVLVSCKGNADSGDTSDTSDTKDVNENQSTEGDETEYVLDDLPDDLDYGGKEFVILCGEGRYGKSYAENYTGDIVNSALYNRQIKVQERLNIALEFDLVADGFNEMDEVAMRLGSGANEWDLVQVYNLTPALLAVEGLSADMAKTEYLNFDKPWWSSTLMENISINGKVFFTTDNSSWINLRNMMALFVDKSLFEINHSDKSIEDLYDMVEEGKWTMEEMFKLVKGTYNNTNGDESVDEEDTFGLSIGSNPWMESWYYAAGFTTLNKDANEQWSFNISSHAVDDFISYFQSQFYGNDDCTNDTKQYRQFCQGRSMFYLSSLSIVEQNIKNEFTVLPLPMYTTDQGRYYTHFSNTYDMFSIPVTLNADERDCSSAVLECLASEAYRQIAPAYFENYLKKRNTSDARMGKMFDIIRESIVFDMGVCYSASLSIDDDLPQYYPRRVLHTPSDSIAARWTASVEAKYMALWQEIQNKLMATDK